MAFTSGSPSAGQLEIGIALVLQDRFSNQAREASSVIRGLHRDAKNAIQANLTAAQSYSNFASGVATTLTAALMDTVTVGADFIDMMVSVEAISQGTEEQMSRLSETAQTLGLETMFMSRDIASGMKYLAMAGNDAVQIQEMIGGAAMMANATGMALGGKGGSADLLTNIMRTFKLEGENAANVVGDQLTKAAMSSNVSMMDLAESIKYSAASMVTLRQQLPQVAAMIGTLGNAGIQGSMAGTSIRNMADYLTRSITNPNYKGAKALAGLGLSKQDFIDSNGDLLDFAVILEKIGDATENLSTIDQNNVFRSIFGVRGMRGAVAIMRDTEGYFDLLNKIQNESTGFAGEVVGKRMESLAGKIDIVKSAVENLKTTFAQALEKNPVIMGMLDMAAWAISQLRNLLATPLGPWIAGIGAIGTAVIFVGNKIMNTVIRWRILNSDSQVSFRNMIRLIMGGWSEATISAAGYMKMEQAIIAQRNAGIGSNIGGALMKQGMPIGGVVMTASGRYRDVATGRFVNQAAANAAANSIKGNKMNSLIRNLMGLGTVGAGVAARTAGKSALLGIGSKLLGFGAKFVGLLGGPIGIGITAISIGLPWLISAIRGNKNSSDSNTTATNDLANAIRASREGYKKANSGYQSATADELRFMVQALNDLTNKISDPKNTNHITINLDGKTFMEEIIDGKNTELQVAAGVK